MVLDKIDYTKGKIGEIYSKVKNNELPLGELVLQFAKWGWSIYLNDGQLAEKHSDLEGLGLTKSDIEGLEKILDYSYIDDNIVSVYKYNDTYSILVRVYLYENNETRIKYILIEDGQFNDDEFLSCRVDSNFIKEKSI